jgi:hypothetical protein
MYVYKKTEPGLWTVGYYEPDGTWQPESDHDNTEDAAKRVAWLNGSNSSGEWDVLLHVQNQERERERERKDGKE